MGTNGAIKFNNVIVPAKYESIDNLRFILGTLDSDYKYGNSDGNLTTEEVEKWYQDDTMVCVDDSALNFFSPDAPEVYLTLSTTERASLAKFFFGQDSKHFKPYCGSSHVKIPPASRVMEINWANPSPSSTSSPSPPPSASVPHGKEKEPRKYPIYNWLKQERQAIMMTGIYNQILLPAMRNEENPYQNFEAFDAYVGPLYCAGLDQGFTTDNLMRGIFDGVAGMILYHQPLVEIGESTPKLTESNGFVQNVGIDNYWPQDAARDYLNKRGKPSCGEEY